MQISRICRHSRWRMGSETTSEAEGQEIPRRLGKESVKATGLAEPSINPADDEDCDSSREKRLAIECIFVLTMEEKHRFMDAVNALGPLVATQEIYKAVIAAAPKVSGGGA